MFISNSQTRVLWKTNTKHLQLISLCSQIHVAQDKGSLGITVSFCILMRFIKIKSKCCQYQTVIAFMQLISFHFIERITAISLYNSRSCFSLCCQNIYYIEQFLSLLKDCPQHWDYQTYLLTLLSMASSCRLSPWTENRLLHSPQETQSPA